MTRTIYDHGYRGSDYGGCRVDGCGRSRYDHARWFARLWYRAGGWNLWGGPSQ